MKQDYDWNSGRFPGIEWHCDRCDAILNFQPGFDDHHYIWKCTNCGYKTSISKADILELGLFARFIGVLLGWIRSATATVLIPAIIIYLLRFQIGDFLIVDPPLGVHLTLFFYLPISMWIFIIAYIIEMILSMLFERKVAHYASDISIGVYIITTPFVYLVTDLVRPFVEVIKFFTIFACRSGRHIAKRIGFLVIYAPIVAFFIYRAVVIYNEVMFMRYL